VPAAHLEHAIACDRQSLSTDLVPTRLQRAARGAFEAVLTQGGTKQRALLTFPRARHDVMVDGR